MLTKSEANTADKTKWDWEVGQRPVADIGQWTGRFEWVEEPQASPDGEAVAAVVKTGEMEFSVCVNGEPWENVFDKVWFLRFTADGRLCGNVSDTAEWAVAVDGEAWENKFEYIWDTRFPANGGSIVCAAKSGMDYFAVTDGAQWEKTYANITGLIATPAGDRSAAVVQTVDFNEGEIFKFKDGCYSVAVDGAVWPRNFVNVWDLSFSPDGSQVAGTVRVNLYDYTIAVNGDLWPQQFSCAWQPKFHPTDGSVSAPVQTGGKWRLFRDGSPLWDNRYVQLWHHIYSPAGDRIAAIVAPRYGRWTVAVDDVPWDLTFGDMVTDAVFSPDGSHVACIGVENERRHIVVDGKKWSGDYDMAWPPVFSPDSRHVAAKLETQGRYRIAVNGVEHPTAYTQAWDPVFSPDGTQLMIRGIEGDGETARYTRTVINVADITG